MAGCSAGAGTVHPGTGNATFTQHYFEGLASSPVAACAPVANGDLVGQSLDVSLFFGADAGDEGVVAEGSRLQRFFDPYGLQFRATGAATATTLRYAMNGTAAQLNAALDPLGLPLDGELTDEQWQQAGAAVGAVIFADLRDFVQAHVEERTVHFVVLEHVLAPELSEYLFGSDGPKIIGFTVSPTLFRRVDASDPEYSLWRMTGLSGDFTPTSFIGDADVGYLPGSTMHGLPRTTQDLDLVIDPPSLRELDALVASIPPEDCYVDAETARDAFRRRSMFNVVDHASGWKVDFILRKERAFSREEFARRMPASLLDVPIFVASPEDTVISKLEWSKQSGGSERQRRDVAGILATVGAQIDRPYVERWVRELDLVDEWEAAQATTV